jgi:hypothetical protein
MTTTKKSSPKALSTNPLNRASLTRNLIPKPLPSISPNRRTALSQGAAVGRKIHSNLRKMSMGKR